MWRVCCQLQQQRVSGELALKQHSKPAAATHTHTTAKKSRTTKQGEQQQQQAASSRAESLNGLLRCSPSSQQQLLPKHTQPSTASITSKATSPTTPPTFNRQDNNISLTHAKQPRFAQHMTTPLGAGTHTCAQTPSLHSRAEAESGGEADARALLCLGMECRPARPKKMTRGKRKRKKKSVKISRIRKKKLCVREQGSFSFFRPTTIGARVG